MVFVKGRILTLLFDMDFSRQLKFTKLIIKANAKEYSLYYVPAQR